MLHTINTLDQLKPILKGFRKSQDLTQQDMADMLGVSQQTYQKLESAPQNVTVDRLFKVLGLLGIKLCLRDSATSSTSTNKKTTKSHLAQVFSKLSSVSSDSALSNKTRKFVDPKKASNKKTSVMKKTSKKEKW